MNEDNYVVTISWSDDDGRKAESSVQFESAEEAWLAFSRELTGFAGEGSAEGLIIELTRGGARLGRATIDASLMACALRLEAERVAERERRSALAAEIDDEDLPW